MPPRSGRPWRACRHLLASRQHRAAIAALVDLLGELEDIGWQEADRTVFTELAMLFEDIAQHALRGAEDLRLLERKRENPA